MNPPGDRALLGVCALLFAASAAVTVVWCSSMGVTSGMPMPGNWTMSMAWMRMPGQTWLSAGASFLTMWIAMMVAMMLPSLVPMLRHYREAVVTSDAARLGQLTVTVAVAYFFVRPCSESPPSQSGSHSPQPRCSGLRWHVRFRQWPPWSLWSAVHFNLRAGRRITSRASARDPSAAACCRRTSVLHGGTALVSGSTALSAAVA